MYCTNCGKEIADGSVFCRHCGEQIGDDKTVYVVKDDANSELKKIAASNYVKSSPVERRTIPPVVFVAGGIAVVVVLAVITGGVLLKKNSAGSESEVTGNVPESSGADESVTIEGASEGTSEGTGTEAATGTTEEPDGTAGEVYADVSISVVGANETGALSGAIVQLKGSGYEEYAETDAAGHAEFSVPSDGKYTIKCNADGYNENLMDLEIAGMDADLVVPMIPVVTGDDAFVYLTWNGDHDLDLCAFNTELQEYVNIGHPADSTGNVFLYADHGADLPYEVIYIHDTDDEITKTFFVTEAKNAREGIPSKMEADGVTIKIYDKTGLAYSSTARIDETAALWCPCYCYAGSFYEQQDYIYDVSGEQYEWISFEERDAYTGE